MEDQNKQSSPEQATGYPDNIPQDQEHNGKDSTYPEFTHPESIVEPLPQNPDQTQQYQGQQQYYQEQSQPYQGQPQFYQGGQQYQQYQNGVSPTPLAQNGSYYQQPKKKSYGKVIALAVVLVILLTGTATAFAFRAPLVNTYAQLTKSPVEYYAFVEKNNINASKDYMKTYLDTTSEDTAINVKSDVTLDRDSIDSLLQKYSGESLADLESQIGIPVKSFGFNILYGKKDDLFKETIGLRFNQVDILTAELLMDYAKSDYFVRLPELSDAYLNLSDELATEDLDLSNFKLPETDKTIDLVSRYSDLIIDNISDVELDKDAELSCDTLTEKCSKLTVTISNDDLYDILEAILEEAKDDEYIRDLLSVYSVAESDYEDAIEDALDSLDDSSDDLLEEDIEMIVYVDSNGAIIGREFSTDSTDTVFSYSYLTKNSYNEYNLSVNDVNGDSLLDISGSHTKKGETYDGSAEIEISDPSGYSFDEVNIDVDYSDYRTELKDKHYYQYGTITISSSDLLGIEITSESSVNNNIQNNTLTIQMGGDTLATIDSSAEYLKEYKIEMPSDDAQIYDTSDIDSYASSIDIDAYINKLSDKLGVDLQSVIDNVEGLFSSDSYYDDYTGAYYEDSNDDLYDEDYTY